MSYLFAAYGVNGNPSLMNQMTAQVQQQQLLLYQQMLSQQHESAERLRRLEQTVLGPDQTDYNVNPFHMSPYSNSSLLQPLSVASNTLLATGRPAANSLLTTATAATRNPESAVNAPTVRPFQFQPRPFAGLNNANNSGDTGPSDDHQPQLSANSMYSSSGNRETGLNQAAQNITVTVNNTARQAGRLVQQRQQGARAAAGAIPRSNLNTQQQSDRSHLYRVEDVVPIETIQASDQRVPPLNLNRVMNSNKTRLVKCLSITSSVLT